MTRRSRRGEDKDVPGRQRHRDTETDAEDVRGIKRDRRGEREEHGATSRRQKHK